MSLVEEVADVLHDTDTCEDWVFYRDPAKQTEEEWEKEHHAAHVAQAPSFISAFAARGIDLDLAHQWQRAEKALPEGWILELGDWTAEPHRTDPVFEANAQPYSAQRSDQARFVTHSTPAGALSALADMLEAQK